MDKNLSPIKCKAAVAWEAKKPLDITEIEVGAPRQGEIRVKVLTNALCHTDIYTLEGHDPEGLFPCILGHEATGIVESIGPGVTTVKEGDMIVPCYTPECRDFDCIFCQSDKTNLCPKIRATQGKGLMPDGTSRFSKDGKAIYHFMGCSTFSEYTVIAEISAAKINPLADPMSMCLLGCGISTGWGAVYNTCKVEPSTSVVVFGLGAVGLAIIQAAKISGCTTIIGVDINSSKFEIAKKIGATHCFNSKECDNIKDKLLTIDKWGFDYTFDCTGNVEVMRTALEVAHRGWGESCVVGVAAAGKEIQTRPFQLVTGRNWKGTAFGGWKSRSDVPKLVQRVMTGEFSVDEFITNRISGLENVNLSIDALHSGNCLRAVVEISKHPSVSPKIKLIAEQPCEGGVYKRYSHFSKSCQCEMTFGIFLPFRTIKEQRGDLPPVLFFLGGLTCTDENIPMKSAIHRYAAKHKIAVLFPDTSPRGEDVALEPESGDFGSGAGFYLNATQEKYKKHYNMFDYISKEMPEILKGFFPVDSERLGITGSSMGGLGAINCYLKSPGLFKSVSAFSPISNPTNCPWGQKAFNGYLGSVEAGKEYDPVELIKTYNGPKKLLLVDQGTADAFLEKELKVEILEKTFKEKGYPIQVRWQKNYTHSFYFVMSFVEDHVEHHARELLYRNY